MLKFKSVFILSGVIVVILTVPALAKEIKFRPTSKGAVFIKMDDGWTVAPDGTRWSGNQGKFSNEGPYNQYGFVTDSAAIRACAAIGGVLPAAAHYEVLMQYFDYDAQGFLTPKGREEFLKIFPDIKPDKEGVDGEIMKYFWTSSISDNQYAYFGKVFDGLCGVQHLGLRGEAQFFGSGVPAEKLWVRCVQNNAGSF